MSRMDARAEGKLPGSAKQDHGRDRELDRLLGIEDPASRSDYVERFHAEVASFSWTKSRESEMLAAARRHDVILLGEYHPLPGACRTAERLIEELASSDRPCTLGVEMVHARDQHALDAYLAGRIGRRELARRIRYEEEWGYPFAPVIRLLARARERGLTVVGLDIPPRGTADDLGLRDRVAAERIAARHDSATGPRSRWVVLYGEAHLAEPHLPRAISRRLPPEARVMRVFHDLPVAEDAGSRFLSSGQGVFACRRVPPAARARALAAVYRRWAASVPQPTEIDVPLVVHELIDGHAHCLDIDPRRRLIGPALWLADAYPSVYAPGERSRAMRHLREAGVTGAAARAVLERAERDGTAFEGRANVTVVSRPDVAAISSSGAAWLDGVLAPAAGAAPCPAHVAAAAALARLLTCRVDPRAPGPEEPSGDGSLRALEAALAERDVASFRGGLDALRHAGRREAYRFGARIGTRLFEAHQRGVLDTARLGSRVYPEGRTPLDAEARLVRIVEELACARRPSKQ